MGILCAPSSVAKFDGGSVGVVYWIRLHNRVKESACWELLAPSQRRAFCAVREAARYANRINVYGESGTGKTFLGWTLARELGVLYLPDPSDQMERAEVMVIDESPSTRSQSRLLYDTAQQYAKSVVLLTRKPIEDHIVQVHLSITEEDMSWVKDTLNRLEGTTRGDVGIKPGLLWNYLAVGVR